ncbi:MAG: ABC transporter ATP-binding protein, partial [Anaerovoracaceae bacterium]
MLKRLQHKYALSQQGAKDLIKGSLCCFLQNMLFMFPVGLIYMFVGDMIDGGVYGNRVWFYAAGAVLCLVLIFAVTRLQSNA